MQTNNLQSKLEENCAVWKTLLYTNSMLYFVRSVTFSLNLVTCNMLRFQCV